MNQSAISKDQWFAQGRQPPLDFTNKLEAFGFRHYRRWTWLLCKLMPKLGVSVVLKHLYEARRFPRPNRERELLKQAESFTLDFENGELACWRFAPITAGAPLKTAVLIHGWEGRAAQLGSLVEPLQRKGYQVYLMDLPAHGDSDGFRSNPVKAAAAIQRLATKVGAIDLLVAHSFGACASMLAMLKGVAVKQFIALAGVVDYRVVLRDVRIMFNVPASAKAAFDARAQRELGLGDWSQINLLAQAANIQAACTYLHDPMDEDTPCFAAQEMAAALPNAEWIPVEGVGHRSIMWSKTVLQYLDKNV